MDQLKKVEAFIKKHDMIREGDIVAAGISGGADSVCLLLMLSEMKERLGFDLYAVNVEHGIRGRESIEDSRFVEDLCTSLDLPFYGYSVSVPELAKESGQSLEEAARNARYEIFYRAMQEHGGNKLAIAHNMNDNAETLVHNMARGTSLTGLSGIHPVRDNIIRPLLCLSRKEIEDYLKEKNRDFRIDSTNLSEEYTRNRIRSRIIPELAAVNPLAGEHMMNLSEDLREAADFIEGYISGISGGIVTGDGEEIRVSIRGLQNEAAYIRRELIRRLISDLAGGARDIGRVHINDCLDLAAGQTGRRINLPMGLEAIREYDSLIFRKAGNISDSQKPDKTVPVEVPGETKAEGIRLVTSFPDKNHIKIEKKTYTKLIDCDKIKGGLFLRHRRTGDMMVINGDGGRISLKDYFINEKIPRKLRDEIWLICDEIQVIWIIGYRLSEAFKVQEETKKVLKLELTEGEDGRED